MTPAQSERHQGQQQHNGKREDHKVEQQACHHAEQDADAPLAGINFAQMTDGKIEIRTCLGKITCFISLG